MLPRLRAANPAPLIFALTVIHLLLAGVSPARAQGNPYCSITEIRTVRLANAVQIVVQADGIMQVDWDANAFFNVDAFSRGRIDQIWKPVSVLPFRIRNARAKVGPFTDVGVYPASHVEVSVPPDVRDGIGLDLRVVLFTPATTLAVETPYGIDLQESAVPGPTATVALTPDKTRLIIIVTGDRQVVVEPARPGPPPGATVSLTVSATGDEVSIDALNADIRDVIREISRQTGRDVVADGVLERTVSLSLRETSVDEALDALALACGLTLEKSGGLIRATDGRANSLPGYGQSAFEVIRLKHITAAGARNSLPDVLLRYLHLDAGENALTVSGPQSVIAKVRKDLAVLDRPVPQIEVEALIVEFTATDDRNRLWRGEQRWDGERLGVDAGTGDIVFETASELQAGFATSLQALVQSGRARVRARPRAVAKNGETAKLFVGQQKFIKVAEYNAFEEADYVRIMGVDLGVSLTVTPWTGDSREITVDIVPEVSSIAEREPRTGLPTVFTRNAHATLRLRSGDTVMIGGLVDDQPERRRRRIPILGSLPLIGPFFHTVEARRVRHELTIFLTARVQDGAAQPSPLTLSGPGTDHGDTR